MTTARVGGVFAGADHAQPLSLDERCSCRSSEPRSAGFCSLRAGARAYNWNHTLTQSTRPQDCSARTSAQLQAAPGCMIFRLARVGPSCGLMSWCACPWAPSVFRLAKAKPCCGPASWRMCPWAPSIFRLAKAKLCCGPASWRMCPWAPSIFRLTKAELCCNPASWHIRPQVPRLFASASFVLVGLMRLLGAIMGCLTILRQRIGGHASGRAKRKRVDDGRGCAHGSHDVPS